jgi:large subunit ribosomal protein L32
MATPKKRTSRARRDKRRSHNAITLPQIGTCPKSGRPKLSHRVCEESGYYGKDKQVFDVDERL